MLIAMHFGLRLRFDPNNDSYEKREGANENDNEECRFRVPAGQKCIYDIWARRLLDGKHPHRRGKHMVHCVHDIFFSSFIISLLVSEKAAKPKKITHSTPLLLLHGRDLIMTSYKYIPCNIYPNICMSHINSYAYCLLHN